MTGLKIKTNYGVTIRFRYYTDTAPVTSEAFNKSLPFSLEIFHARVSGEEIWSDNAPQLDIVQENASVFTEQGEFVIAPVNPQRNKVKNCLGIFYGEGKLVDCCNIFAKVFDEDLPLLKALGDKIWKEGAQQLIFDKLN